MLTAPSSLGEVVRALEALWPLDGAEDWDSPGLTIGDTSSEIKSIHLMVDVTLATVREAIDLGADLIVAHHPLLFRPVSSLPEFSYKGKVIAELIRSETALYVAHTNADAVPTGTSAQLAELLGLVHCQPIVPSKNLGHGLGLIGNLPEPMQLHDLAAQLGDGLPLTAVGPVVAGDASSLVSSVSLCAGAGDTLLSHRLVQDSDVFISSDLRHHPVSESREQAILGRGPAIINISHFASEWLWLGRAKSEIGSLMDLKISVSEINTDPWTFQIQRVKG